MMVVFEAPRYVRCVVVDVDVVELSCDEAEDDHVKALVERLAAWKELIELALNSLVVFHRTGDYRHHVTT